ncbi:MAG: hypothetical protein QM642_06255 [Edaphocola sp.]
MKKKVLLASMALVAVAAAQAQTQLAPAKTVATKVVSTKTVATRAVSTEKGATTEAIMGKLTPALALKSTQTSGVSAAVSSYLKSKQNIASLKESQPAAYASKSTSSFNDLKTNLGKVLTAEQMTKFMSLKAKNQGSSGVLSSLFN